jgi:hypothetical protein
MAQERVSFSEVLRVRLPLSVSHALARAAAEDLTTISEVARRALVEHLRGAGIPVRATRDDAGAAPALRVRESA